MKSIVFSFKKRYLFRRSKGISPSDVRFFIRRYSVVLIFVSAFLTGLVFGSIYASKADKQMLDSLDFLFTTNLDARLGQNAVSTFCACFAFYISHGCIPLGTCTVGNTVFAVCFSI